MSSLRIRTKAPPIRRTKGSMKRVERPRVKINRRSGGLFKHYFFQEQVIVYNVMS